jgi:predicted acetylornithine/succinylornithine family transaminase
MPLQERERKNLFHTYNRIPLEIDRGNEVYLYTKDGKRYLDFFGGLAVNALGYGHPKILKAIQEQVSKYIHLSNYYLQEPQILLAEQLVKHTGYQKVFFSNSGTEAIEGAIKIARKWGTNDRKSEIISFTNAFHGRTLGALSLMDREKYRAGFEPLLDNCRVIKYNDTVELNNTINRNTSAVILEFIQGEGGIISASVDFISSIKSLREKFGFIIIADEIQSGFGRTGKLFGFQHYGIEPDIVVVAKALGGGLPLGAILGNAKTCDVLNPGMHGSTFGGNPVACAAGFVVLNEIINGGVMLNAEAMGKIISSDFMRLREIFPSIVKDVRGRGLMLGMELHFEGEKIVNALRDRNVLINCTNGNVLRFLPPLIINESHAQELIKQLEEVFSSL